MVLEASNHRHTADRAEHLGDIAQSTRPPDIVIEELANEAADWTRDLDALDERWLLAAGEATDVCRIALGPDSCDRRHRP